MCSREELHTVISMELEQSLRTFDDAGGEFLILSTEYLCQSSIRSKHFFAQFQGSIISVVSLLPISISENTASLCRPVTHSCHVLHVTRTLSLATSQEHHQQECQLSPHPVSLYTGPSTQCDTLPMPM